MLEVSFPGVDFPGGPQLPPSTQEMTLLLVHVLLSPALPRPLSWTQALPFESPRNCQHSSNQKAILTFRPLLARSPVPKLQGY